jgi:DNA-binding beta-propeller fold protein YncE
MRNVVRSMNRREFLLAAAAAPVALRYAAAPPPLAYVTADTESRVAVVDMLSGAIVRRIETLPSPFSIERVGDTALVAHTVSGRVTVLGRHVVDGFGEPRYTAAAPDGRYAFVTDSGNAELVSVDVVRGAIVGRAKLSRWPRHLSLAPDGRTLWVSLGTASDRIDVVDISDPTRPRLRGSIKPPFLAHDVGVAPSGRLWITSGDVHTISAHGRLLAAGGPPQHVTFLDGRAFVTSGADGTLQVYDERSVRLLATTRIPVGSYNVQFAAGRVLTPSLDRGTLCVLDANGRSRVEVRVAPSSHDACLAP